MEKQEVKVFYKYPTCDECGEKLETADNSILTSMPAQRKFKCSECGHSVLLREEYWPHQVLEFLGEEIE